MNNGRSPAYDASSEQSMTISTGQTVELPVRLRATMFGATFAAPTADVTDLLPDGLEPIRATLTGNAAVTLLSIEYHEIDIPGMKPYDEFAVIIPASHTSPTKLPYVSAVTRATNGYVWYMPVTTEPATAFGVDVWGFPKVVADITHTDAGSRRETTVTVNGEHFATVEIDRPPAFDTTDTGLSYTVKDGSLLTVPSTIDAELGGWPFSTKVSVSLGDHPKAAPLRSLDLGQRALGRIYLDGDVYFYQGKSVAAHAN